MTVASIEDARREREIRALAHELSDHMKCGRWDEAHVLFPAFRDACLSRSPAQVERMENRLRLRIHGEAA